MCSPLISWAKLVPLHPSPQGPACAGGGGAPADRRSLWELGTHALWTKAQLLTLTISFSWPGI